MKIHILTVMGSPQKVTEETIYGDGTQLGVGGAELALLTMCAEWSRRGHDVTLYNNPRKYGASSFKQEPETYFDPNEDRDILIYFRGPNKRGLEAKGKKVWWSCDQQTVGDYPQLAREVAEVVTISKFHAKYFESRYGISDTITIDCPVRVSDYEIIEPRNPLQVLFCSIPDRGLEQLAGVWKLVTEQVPDAQLHITSDWRLWDATLSPAMVAKYRIKFAGFDNVNYHSLVTRQELIKLQYQSSVHLYPCIYDELFCISSAECQYAGAYPITSGTGALATTNMGYISPLDPKSDLGMEDLAKETIYSLQHQDLLSVRRDDIISKAHNRFSVSSIADIWEKEVFA